MIGPPEVIARKQVTVLIEQRHMSARVPWRRDDEQIVGKLNIVAARNPSLNIRSEAAHIIGVHHALGLEMLGPLPVIGHVISMGQKDRRHAAKRGHAFYERARKARRIDKHVAFGPDYQIARRAE